MPHPHHPLLLHDCVSLPFKAINRLLKRTLKHSSFLRSHVKILTCRSMSAMTATQQTAESPQNFSSLSIESPPSNNGKTEIIVTSLLLGIAAVFVLNRLYLKTCITRKFTLDDRKPTSLKVEMMQDCMVLTTPMIVTITLALVSHTQYCSVFSIVDTDVWYVK